MGVPFPWAGARKLQSLAAWLARHSQHVRKLSFSIRVADDDEMSVWGPAAACIDAVAATGQLEELNLDSMPVSTDSFALAALSSLRRLSLARSVRLTPAISALTALESLILTGDTDCPTDVRLPSSITRLIVERDGDGDVTEQAAWLPFQQLCSGWQGDTCTCRHACATAICLHRCTSSPRGTLKAESCPLLAPPRSSPG